MNEILENRKPGYIALKKINVGVIGLGNMGFLHLMDCLHMEDVNVVAVSDKSKHSLRKAEKLGVKNSFEDYQEMINNKALNIDAVIISLPNYLHFTSIQFALEAGINVFIEKPMTVSVEEGREVVRLVEKNGRVLMPGHSMRYIPAISEMKTTVEKGKVGNPRIITIESIQNGPLAHGALPKPVPEWWFDPKKSGGGALIDLGYHLIDLFRYFAGDAHVRYSYLDYNYNLPVEDGASLILESNESGIRGIVNVGWFEKTIFPRFNFRMMVHGNADFVSTEQFLPRSMYVHAVKEGMKNFSRRITGRKIHPLSYTYYYESQYKEVMHFITCLRNDTPPEITAVDGLRALEIIQEAYKYDDNKRE